MDQIDAEPVREVDDLASPMQETESNDAKQTDAVAVAAARTEGNLPLVVEGDDDHMARYLADCEKNMSVQESDKNASSAPSFSDSFNSQMSLSECFVNDDFYCEESENFWKSIDGVTCHYKYWEKFLDAMKLAFPDDPHLKTVKNNRVFKLLHHVFVTKGDKRDQIEVGKFTKLLGWFGPFKKQGNGHCICLHNVHTLIEGSRSKKGKHEMQSWFGGYMDQTQAEDYLAGQPKGTFLLRFSESLAEQGGFSLAVKSSEADTVHLNILGDPKKGAKESPYKAYLHLDGEADMYNDLVTFVERRLRADPVITFGEDEVYCRKTCPNLPLNAQFTGYRKASKAK
ncbi:uncharacterized protein LOC144451360 [Glandiceps talaboti]